MSIAVKCTCVVVMLALGLGPAEVRAASGPVVVVDMAAYEADVAVGQTQYEAGDYLAAARTWDRAARKLPLTEAQRGNVVAVLGGVADAYDRAGATDRRVMREALAVLDDHAVRFMTAYPSVPPSPRVEDARVHLRERLHAGETGPMTAFAVPSGSDVKPPPKPWRGLAVGGAFALAGGVVMSAVFAVGQSRVSAYKDGHQKAALGCMVNGTAGPCGDYFIDYRNASAMQLGGMILAPVLLAGGAALIATAIKRKRAGQPAVVPVVGRGFAGLSLTRQF